MPAATTYREADPERAAQVEAARRAEEEATARTVRDMKSHAVALARLVPGGLARLALVLAVVAFCLPLACAAASGLVGSHGVSHVLRHVLPWVAFVSGGLGSFGAIGVGIAALVVERGNGHGAHVVAIIAGTVAMPLALVCAIAAAGPPW